MLNVNTFSLKKVKPRRDERITMASETTMTKSKTMTIIRVLELTVAIAMTLVMILMGLWCSG